MATNLNNEMSGIYIHIPFCRSKCDYCAFYSVPFVQPLAEQYLGALFQEMNLRSRQISNTVIDTVYIGGGTPSVLPKGSITRILEKVSASFTLTPGAEITVETNPESCTAEFANELIATGVNRVSLGLQSHEDSILKKVGRTHVADDFRRAVSVLTTAGIKNLSADIMMGLPTQSLQSVLDSIAYVSGSSEAVRHISLYALSVESGTPLDSKGYCVDEDLQADMYGEAVKQLERSGFLRYEVSNFAKSGFESKHNCKYWTYTPYFGFGAGAHSLEYQMNDNCYGVVERAENYANLERYLAGQFEEKRETISSSVRIEEMLMLALRTRNGLDLAEYCSLTARNLLVEKCIELENLMSLGLVSIQQQRLRVTEKGFYVLNSIILKLI